MDNDTQKIITDQLEKLPVNIRNAILSADYRSKLQTITKDNKLMIDQAGKLETETILIMLGLEPLDDYTDNLVNNVGLTKNQAIAIAHDVDELIFKNIRESLQKINDQAKATGTSGNVMGNSVWQPTNQPIKKTIPGAENSVEIKTENEDNLLPEIYPETILPAQSILTKQEPYHENISPVANIVQSKMTETVIVPKENIIVEEKSKLPEKSKFSDSSDPYREPIS